MIVEATGSREPGDSSSSASQGRRRAPDTAEIAYKLRDAMAAVGIDPIPELIADGKPHRFDSPTDKRGRQSGWYVLFESGVAVLDSWKGDIAHQAISPNGNSNGKLSRVDRQKIEHAKRQAEAERKKLQDAAAEKARRLAWLTVPISQPSEHGYLVRKHIQPNDARLLVDRAGKYGGDALVVPLFDERDEIVNLQFIKADGGKRFLTHGKVQGCYCLLADSDKKITKIAIGEGFATVASVCEAIGIPGAIAFNAGNLLAVAKRLRKKQPSAEILIIADDDRTGLAKAREAAQAVGARLVIPKFPEGVAGTDFNDLACALGRDTVRKQIEAAIDNGVPANFKLTKDALYLLRERTIKGESEVEEVSVCSPLKVLALTRDRYNGEWGRLLEFPDPDGHLHEWAMPMEMLAGEGLEYRARLLEKGLTIRPSKDARYALHEYINQCRPAARATAVTRVGWHENENVFVLPDTVFGETQGERTLYQSAIAITHAFNVRGTLEDWQREISARCVGNSRLIFAASAGFAAPLLHLTNDESGGFHFVGPSSLGKTTALRVGGSVWGGSSAPAGYLRQWRATANGLEGIAAMRCDALICLDEMGQVNAREAGEVGYLLANGQGKSRASRDGSARSPFTWRVIFLSSGEITLADKIREDGRQRAMAGQQVRILDVPAQAGNFGLFENLHGTPSGQEFADALRIATQQTYGTAARAFLSEIVKQPERIAGAVRRYRDDFIAQRLPNAASEQVGRAAARFGLVAAAGELATAFDITGWNVGAAAEAAGECFKAWLTYRGHVGPAEIEAGIEQVRHFFALHGGSRFGTAENSGIDSQGRTVTNRAGFRKDGNFWVYPEIFRSEIATGHDWRALADALATRGLLKRDKDAKVQCPVRDPDGGKLIRMMCFAAAIVGQEVTGDEG